MCSLHEVQPDQLFALHRYQSCSLPYLCSSDNNGKWDFACISSNLLWQRKKHYVYGPLWLVGVSAMSDSSCTPRLCFDQEAMPILVYHYRKPCVCRVPRDLPWAKPRAPGKRSVCRVQTKAAHGKGKAHGILASLTWASRGNTRWKFGTRQTRAFAVCQKSNTRQTHVLPCALVEHTANMWGKFWICPQKFFC